jgi:hypothetical protein
VLITVGVGFVAHGPSLTVRSAVQPETNADIADMEKEQAR